MSDLYKKLGKLINSSIKQDWSVAIVRITSSLRKMCKFECSFSKGNNLFDSFVFDDSDGFELGFAVFELQEAMYPQNTSGIAPSTRWRRTVISTWNLYGIRHFRTNGTRHSMFGFFKKKKVGDKSDMDEMKEIYSYIGTVLNKGIGKIDWNTIILNIEAAVGYCGFDGTYTDSSQSIHDLDIEIPFEMYEKILHLLELSEKNNFAPWNRAVYTLEKNGHFDMEFIWDQALQDEWDKA